MFGDCQTVGEAITNPAQPSPEVEVKEFKTEVKLPSEVKVEARPLPAVSEVKSSETFVKGADPPLLQLPVKDNQVSNSFTKFFVLARLVCQSNKRSLQNKNEFA